MLTTKSAGALSGVLAGKEGFMDKVEIKILADTICDGERVRAGDVVTATVKSARYLLGTKKAEPFVGTQEAPATRTRKPKAKK